MPEVPKYLGNRILIEPKSEFQPYALFTFIIASSLLQGHVTSPERVPEPRAELSDQKLSDGPAVW